ncbi:MAG: DNA-protecting protein DprA [Myxococcales bacterium]|nr:MAG: DNA-protecting protein DprA [Myxococcales bacterium]
MAQTLFKQSCIQPNSPVWPSRLQKLGKAPKQLWVCGDGPGDRPSVAVVGTRRASSEALGFTRELCAALAQVGLTIVSGGAHGIDTAAHQGALDGDGTTTVVLASPLDRPYPRRNHALFSTIVDRGGVLLSEQQPGQAIASWMFVQRNRLIAALSQVVLVVQAPVRSGALITAKWAQDLDIPVFFVPASPWDPRGQGALSLAKRGGLICTSVQDVLSHPALRGLKKRPRMHENPMLFEQKTNNIKLLDGDQQQIATLLKQGPMDRDGLIQASGLSAKRVQTALVMLSLAARVQELPGGRFRLR